MGSLNLDEGGAVGMTTLLAHSAWGVVTPEIFAPRFRQGTSGERDGTGSGLSGGSVSLVALRSHLSSRRGAMAVGSRRRRSLIASVEVLLGLAERAIPLAAIPFRAT